MARYFLRSFCLGPVVNFRIGLIDRKQILTPHFTQRSFNTIQSVQFTLTVLFTSEILYHEIKEAVSRDVLQNVNCISII